MLIRKLLPLERDQLLAHLLRLDSEARRLRFMAFVKEAFITAYVQRIDFDKATVLGLFIAGELRGIAEVVPAASGDAAEIAFSLEADWRGKGHGRRLLARAVDIARLRGFSQVHMTALMENRPVRKLAGEYDTVRSFIEDGTYEVDIAVPAANSLAPIERASEDAIALWHGSILAGHRIACSLLTPPAPAALRA